MIRLHRRGGLLVLSLIVGLGSIPSAATPPPVDGSDSQQASLVWHDPSPHRVSFVRAPDGIELEVLDWGGDGRPVVLLAGSGWTAHVFGDFAPKLTSRYRVYGITRRGFGASGFAAGKYGIDLLGDDVLEVIAALKLERPILVGHSFAGGELSSVATRAAGRIAGAVYLDAAYPVAFENDESMSAAEFQQIARAPAIHPPGDEDLASFDALQRYYERVVGIRLPQAALRHNWEATSAGAVGARRRFPGSETLMRGTRQFSAIPVPALIIFANPQSLGPWRENHPDASVRTVVKDFLARSEMLTRKQEIALRRAVPSARVVVLRGANHFVFMSNEAEVMRELDAFIPSVP